ncbi:MAG: TetR family transcriptional regulator C-terminal domain-containing protein [Alishewanella sp.]|nr:TetR family transcriptional regulator C-terminal domain-containing protein [Alishewanella sp.]
MGWEGAVARARLLQSAQPLQQFGQFFLKQLTH